MAQHLVIQLARFGDAIQTKRLLLSLASDGDTVHLAVDTSLAAFARQIYPFAVVHEIRAHATGTSAAEVFLQNREAFAVLGAIAFDSVYNLNFSGMGMALAGLFDPDSVRGYNRRNGQPFRSRWMRMGFRWMANRRISPMNLADFWAYLHPDPIAPGMVNPLPSPKEGGRVAVVAAGREARRSLPPEVLAPLVESVFAARGGPDIIILGGQTERPFARKLSRLFRPAVLQKVDDACGRTSLADLAGILSGCDLVLTPDTGLMHLAAHLGVPVTAFFLSSAWCFETGPYGDGHTVFQATRSCAPCVESRPCRYATACLAPFTEPAMAKQLYGKEPEPWPEGIARLRAECGAFGCDCRLERGALPELGDRADLRNLLAEFQRKACASAGASRYAETIFHEMDWILPEAGGWNAPVPFAEED